MRRLAFADLRAFFDERGKVKPMSHWTDEMASQAHSVETVLKNAKVGNGMVDEVVKFKLHDKIRPLEMLASRTSCSWWTSRS